MMEVYNEKIFDLLSPTGRETSLEVHLGANGRVFVGNLTEERVDSADTIESILTRGSSNRSVASTAMNTDSSRSHLLMQISVTGFNRISKASTVGKLTLVDLAGSERVSKSEASGPRLVEAAAINKSLSALGQVRLRVLGCASVCDDSLP
jgi:kinesin family member C2/C3